VLLLGEAVPIVGKVFKLLAGLKQHFDQFLETEEECRRMSVWCVSMMSVLGKLVRDKQFTVDEDCKQLLVSASKCLMEMSDLLTTRVKSSSRGLTVRMYNFFTTGQYAKQQSEAEDQLEKAFKALSLSVQVETKGQVDQVLGQVQILPKMDKKLDDIKQTLDETKGQVDQVLGQVQDIKQTLANIQNLPPAHKGNVRMINTKADEFWREHFLEEEKVHWKVFAKDLQKTFSLDDDNLHCIHNQVNLEPDDYISRQEFNVWTKDSEDGVKGACDKAIVCRYPSPLSPLACHVTCVVNVMYVDSPLSPPPLPPPSL
jgi:hypothetical protein